MLPITPATTAATSTSMTAFFMAPPGYRTPARRGPVRLSSALCATSSSTAASISLEPAARPGPGTGRAHPGRVVPRPRRRTCPTCATRRPRGRHPLPTAAAFAAAAGRAGIGPATRSWSPTTTGMTGGAARLWWLLRHYGHDAVAVLDGGLGAWHGPLERRRRRDRAGRVRSRASASDDAMTADELHAPARRSTAGDRRCARRRPGSPASRPTIRSRTSIPVAGHIPGAVNVPYHRRPSRSPP